MTSRWARRQCGPQGGVAEAQLPKPPARRLHSPFTSLASNRRFRLLWLSNVFFFGGMWTQTLVLGWLVFDVTGSKFLIGVFTAARLAPLLSGPFSGVLSDKYERVTLLLVANTWAVFALGSLSVLHAIGHTPFWTLVVGGLALGLAQSPSQPARFALVVDLVAPNQVSSSNALNALAVHTTQVIGPAIGGAMIGALGVSWALAISSAWYVVAAIMLLPLRGASTTTQDRPERLARMLAGIRVVIKDPLTRTVLLVTLSANIFVWPVYQSFMPVFAKEVLGLDAVGLGVLLTCGGTGGLVGSLLIAALGDFRFKGALFLFGTGLWGLMWAIFASSHTPALSFVVMALIGFMSAPFGVLQTTLMVLLAPPAFRGRALGLQELAIGAMPLSALVLGGVAQAIGVGLTTLLCGVLEMIAILLVVLTVPALLRYRG